MEWIAANKAWLFSGLFVAAPLAILGWVFAKQTIVQKQRSGNESINIQATGDISVPKGIIEREDSDEH